jgi:hypothetical protein
MTVAIEREYAIDARVDQSLYELCGIFFRMYICVICGYFTAVSSINPVASRTSIFDPNSTGIANVEASATS